jgi:hypothetical protein
MCLLGSAASAFLSSERKYSVRRAGAGALVFPVRAVIKVKTPLLCLPSNISYMYICVCVCVIGAGQK